MAQRIDAVRNRKALVAAAEQIFAEVGPDAPLDLVAKRAHVGRGTLYRHFRDRTDLAAAVYETHLASLEEYVAERTDHPDLAIELLALIAERQCTARGIQPLLLRAAAGRERLTELTTRTRELLAGPLRVSQAAGTLSPEIDVDDLTIVIDMVEGALGARSHEESLAVARRALALVVPGLTNGPGHVPLDPEGSGATPPG